MIIHPIEPVFDKESKVLILGSFPSVKSREAVCLPSTSLANAAWSFERLLEEWRVIFD
jgi:G:T/U-mismatch repair DNA glycosylase